MQPSIPRTAKVVLAALVTCGVGAAPVQADTIPWVSAFTQMNTPATGGYVQVSDRKEQVGATPPGHASASQSTSGEWGSATASASVDNVTGTLGGHTGVLNTGILNTGEPNNGAWGVYSQFQATMGDGFRSFDEGGSPFNWDGKTAWFTLDVDGSVFAPAHLNNVSAYVALILYTPGSVRPGINAFGDEGKIEHYLYYIGNPNQTTTYDTPPINVSPTEYLGDVSSGVHIEQEISPGEDFDWLLMMYGVTYLYAPGELDVDLSHTVTFGYTGPAGATTQSVSGAFNNINQPASVPEPTTFALLGWGVCALVARRRLTKS